MPIYEYKCPRCGVFETLAKELKKETFCSCGKVSELVPSLTAKRKDHIEGEE